MLDKFFQPKSVAIIGASHKEDKVGHVILRNIVQYGFEGRVYPINPKAETLLGRKSYPSVLEVKGEIDLAVIAIPFQFVLPAVEECAKKGIDSAIVISAGFKEAGAEGARIERQLKKRAKQLGIRLIGPNCLGLIDTASRLNASFAAGMPPEGNIAFFSQSGALCTAVLDWALANGIGFSKFISLGNKADVNEVDLMSVLAHDSRTKVVLGYVEGVENGKRFMKVARMLSRRKPLIVAKSGGSSAGARAASSHTGSLVGAEVAYQAAFKQSKVIRATTIRDLFNYGLAFSYQQVPRKQELAIITNAGGPGIIAADACEKAEVTLARFKNRTIEQLRQHLPSTAALYNPVDVIGDAQAERYEKSGDLILKDSNVGGVLFILTPQAMTEIEKTASKIVEMSTKYQKPVFTSFMGSKRVSPGIELLNKGKIPNYPYPEDAISAFKVMTKYREWLKTPSSCYRSFKVNKQKISSIFSKVASEKRFSLGEIEAREVLTVYGFRVPASILAETSEEAIAAAHDIGYPVVMKIASPDILHKSDVGGVKVGLRDPSAVRESFQEIVTRAKRYMPEALIWGVSVQEMMAGGKEVIMGMTRDSQFGPLVMFGLGGIYTEVMKDVSFRVAPIDEEEALKMISELRSYPILKGVRGESSADIEAIVDGLLRLSQLVNDFPQITELDINPVMVKAKGEGTVAIDARIILTDA